MKWNLYKYLVVDIRYAPSEEDVMKEEEEEQDRKKTR